MTTTTATQTTAAARRTRPALNLFGIAFGLAGLAGTWTAAAAAGMAPDLVANVLWLVVVTTWAVLVVRYLRGSTPRVIASELRHPVLGPFAALVPTTALLVGARLIGINGTTGRTVVAVAGLLAVVFGTWFFANLLRGGADIDKLHSGYLLPTTAATLIGAQASAAAGWDEVAHAAFAVGILSWLLVGAVLLARLTFRPALPDALLPTFAIFSAPPAVAGNAWFTMHPGDTGVVQQALLGTFVLLIGAQVLTVPRYVRLSFTLGWWALTFTTGASATYLVHWSDETAFYGWQILAWTAVATATVIIGTIAVRSVTARGKVRGPLS